MDSKAACRTYNILMAEGRKVMTINPWLISLPGLALMLMVLAVNLLGEGLREQLTPEALS